MPLSVDQISTGTLRVNGIEITDIPEDITYANLYAKVVANQLLIGKTYRLTDYKSVNFLNGYQCAKLNSNLNGSPSSNPAFIPRAIYTGNDEVLLLQAITTGELSPIGYSETYDGDVVEYSPLTNKIGVQFDIQNGGSLPNGNLISGFDLQWDGVNNEVYFDMPTGYPVLYGQTLSLFASFSGGSYFQEGYYLTTQNVTSPEISYSNDNLVLNFPKQCSRILLKNNGNRVVLVDLVQSDVTNYDSGSLIVNNIEAIGDAYGYVIKRQDTLRNVTTPFDFRGRVFRRFEVDLSPANPSVGIRFNGIGDDFGGFGTTGVFEDFKCFENAVNVVWNGLGLGFDNVGENDNNVFFGFISDVTIQNGFANNSFGAGNDGNDMSTPVVESSSFGDYCRINVFLRGFKNNTFGSGCQQNLVGEGFEANNIPVRNFIGNSIGNGFRRNNFVIDTQGANYIGATHVYNEYTCNINRRVDNTNVLFYIDNSNNIIVDSVTA
jgi:hypothetical protein